jgi:hypothetical protein
LVLKSNIIPLSSDRTAEITSLCLYLLRCALWYKMQSVLEKIPWAA